MALLPSISLFILSVFFYHRCNSESLDYFESELHLNQLSSNEILLHYNYINAIEIYKKEKTSILKL